MSDLNVPFPSTTEPEVVNNDAPALRVVAIMQSQLAELGQERPLAQAVGEANDNLVYVELSTLLMAMNSRLEEIAHTLATIAQNQPTAPSTNDQAEGWEPDRLPFEEFVAQERRRGESEQELEARWFYHEEYIPPPEGRRETARERVNRVARMAQRFKGYCKRRGLPPSRGGLKRRRKD